jgi:hypothetical protein
LLLLDGEGGGGKKVGVVRLGFFSVRSFDTARLHVMKKISADIDVAAEERLAGLNDLSLGDRRH